MGTPDPHHRLRRSGRRHPVEPGHLAVRAAVLLLARAVRRPDRRGHRRPRHRRREVGRRGRLDRHPRPRRAGRRRPGRRRRHPGHLRDRRQGARGAPRQRLPLGPDRLGLARLAGPRHQRRPEDHGRHHPGADRVRQLDRRRRRSRSGSRPPAPWPSPPAPTSAAGGSSARSARAWSRSPRRRAWPPRPPRPRSSCPPATSAWRCRPPTWPPAPSSGTGVGKKGAAVRWGVAGRMVVAWVITLPAAAVVGARLLVPRPRHRRRRRRRRRLRHPGRRRRG